MRDQPLQRIILIQRSYVQKTLTLSSFLCCLGCMAPPAGRLDEHLTQYDLTQHLIHFEFSVLTILFVIFVVNTKAGI